MFGYLASRRLNVNYHFLFPLAGDKGEFFMGLLSPKQFAT